MDNKIAFKQPENGWFESAPVGKIFEYPTKMYSKGPLMALVSYENGLWHLSVSGEGFIPTYNQIKEARYSLVPDDCHMAMIYPPKSEFVNVHETCLHLFQLSNEEMKGSVYEPTNAG